MNIDQNQLRVEGSKIVNGRGEEIRLRGFCLGGWLNMENSITGYPGNESGQRKAVANVLGEALSVKFFEKFLDHFISRDDLHFIKTLGCNTVRVALNYRHFESDDMPFDYSKANFKSLDRIIQWAQELQIYIILDLHSVQGWQNRGWHCDNPGRESHFWGQKQFEDRAVSLWEELVHRYCNQPFVAGYNLMNEPDAVDTELLNRYYQRATSTIRSIDPNHIIFLDANKYGKNFDKFLPPFADNLVYGYHPYAEPILSQKSYPGKVGEEVYDRNWLENVIYQYSEFMRKYDVPAWAGEFGCIYPTNGDSAYCSNLMRDQIDLFEQYGHHWTIWTYKDIGKLGLVYVNPDSMWMTQTRKIRDIKSNLRCDYWVERQRVQIDEYIDLIVSNVETTVGELPGSWRNLKDNLYGAICEYTLSQMLLPAYADQFRGIDEGQIESLMQSFDFQQCLIREPLATIIRNYTKS